MGDDIGDITGTPAPFTALNAEDPEMVRYVRHALAPKLAFSYHLEPDDVAQDLWLKVYEKNLNRKDIHHPKAFAGKALSLDCLNKQRHRSYEEHHRETVESESVRCKMHGGQVVITHATTRTPEDDLVEKTQLSDLSDTIVEVLRSFPPHDQEIACLKFKGEPVPEIARQTGRSIATIYRIVKAIQKTLMKKLNRENLLDEMPELEGALEDLIVASWTAAMHSDRRECLAAGSI